MSLDVFLLSPDKTSRKITSYWVSVTDCPGLMPSLLELQVHTGDGIHVVVVVIVARQYCGVGSCVVAAQSMFYSFPFTAFSNNS